jgi:hypothetical protein
MQKQSTTPVWVTPVVLLALLILGFGMMIPWFGFYWDDWPIVLAARLQGVNAFWEYYRLERPFSAWTYVLTIPLLGTTPLVWNIFTLLLRWLTVVGMWWSLRIVWPQRRREALWMAMLFAVYPIFTNQPVALAFSQHWICFALYFLSLGAMLKGVRAPRWYWPLTGVALFATLVHMLTMEYFWGLELLKPVFLWIILGEYTADRDQRLQRTIKQWLPYLAVFLLVVGWRLIYVQQLTQGNKPEVLYGLGTSPLASGIQLLQILLQDMVYNLIGAWYQTIEPTILNLTDRALLASLVVAFITAGLTILYLLRMDRDEYKERPDPGDGHWVRQVVLVGLAGALLGPLPAWLIDRQSLFGLHSGRFALAAMFGLSVLIVALLVWFTPRRFASIVFLAVLVGAASGFHLRNSVSYYRSTLKQNQFYWQLYWRAPYIRPGTAILSADELFPYVGRKPTAVTLNLLYPQEFGIRDMGYWFLELYHDVGSKVVPRLYRDRALISDFRTFNFSASSLNSLIIFYKPGAGRCLWVLSPQEADNPDLPEITLQALPVSNLSRIEPEPISDAYPPQELFGAEPAHTWCYYYQKAELARQLEDWALVAELGDEAQRHGYEAGNLNEWLTFIEGYALSGDREKALERTQDVFSSQEEMAPRLCNLWARITTQANPPFTISLSISAVLEEMQCSLSDGNEPGQ